MALLSSAGMSMLAMSTDAENECSMLEIILVLVMNNKNKVVLKL